MFVHIMTFHSVCIHDNAHPLISTKSHDLLNMKPSYTIKQPQRILNGEVAGNCVLLNHMAKNNGDRHSHNSNVRFIRITMAQTKTYVHYPFETAFLGPFQPPQKGNGLLVSDCDLVL